MPEFDTLLAERHVCCFECWLREHWLATAYLFERLGWHEAAEPLVESYKEMI